MTLVQPPAGMSRQPHLIELIEHDPQRANGALKLRRTAPGRHDPVHLEEGCRPMRFSDALVGKIHVRPTGEAVVSVPDALPMP
jgi:hypothetical protein